MKKVLIMLCGLLLVSGVYGAGSQMNFGLNFGIITDDDFSFSPLWWTAGAEFDFQFGDYLMLSPEVTLVGNGFKFKEFLLFPGAVLNFTPGNFFVGGGLVKGIYVGSGTTFVADDFSLKLNAGLISRNIKLTAYLITAFDNLLKKGMLVGATFGFRF